VSVKRHHGILMSARLKTVATWLSTVEWSCIRLQTEVDRLDYEMIGSDLTQNNYSLKDLLRNRSSRTIPDCRIVCRSFSSQRTTIHFTSPGVSMIAAI